MPVRPFRIVPEIEFGIGSATSLPGHARRLGGNSVFLITDQGVRRAGIAGAMADLLQVAGMKVAIFDQVSPNPRDTECHLAAEEARSFGADLIVAVGGGSPIDLAKATAGLVTNGGVVQDWRPPLVFHQSPLPLIAIPTTAGTGSEVTRSVVINDTGQQIKISLRDYQVAPRVALLDPDLTLSMPPSLTAATGMDALTHAIEAFTCKVATPITDAMALQAIGIINRWLPVAVADGAKLEAREKMLLGSLIAGMAFGNSDVASVHSIAEAIGGRYDTPHGVANSIFLPFVFAFNAEVDFARHARVAEAMGIDCTGLSDSEAASVASQRLFALSSQIGIPRFNQLTGIVTDEFPWIAAASQANLSTVSNAREMTESDYLALLERAWNWSA